MLNEIAREDIAPNNLKKIFEDSDYLQKNIEAFQYLKSRDYLNAKNSYKECVNIAKNMDDDYKFADALANYGVTQFFCGRVKDSIESLESAFRVSLKDMNYSDKPRMILHLKIISNLCLAFLSLGITSEALTYANNIIETIKKEKDTTSASSKIFYMKQVLYIFFRVESIVNYVQVYHKYSFNMKEKVAVTNDNKDSEEVHQSIVNRILYFLHKYLRDNDLDSWIQCLTEEGENFKLIKDYNGFVFALFNQYSSLFFKDSEANAAQAKMRIASLCKILIGDKEKTEVDEKDSVQILNEMKSKMSTAVVIYRKLYEYEMTLLNSAANEESVLNDRSVLDVSGIVLKSAPSSKVFVKVFLRHALNCLSQMEGNNIDISTGISNKQITQMKWQITLTLQLIDQDQINLNSFQLFKIDPEITNSLNILFENILYIRYKSKLKKYFMEFMYETLGYRSMEELRYIKDRKFELFLNKNFQIICEGSILTKINFSTSGKKEHFYKLEPKESSIRVYEKKTDKSYKTIFLKDIKKLSYGVNSYNLRKRFKSMQSSQLNAPWLFFSLIKKDRSVDLYLEEPQLVIWFYGLKKFLKEQDTSYKMISVNNFILTKTKLKLINKLKDELSTNKSLDSKHKELVSELLHEKGVQNFSFVKILLLYLKIKKINL